MEHKIKYSQFLIICLALLPLYFLFIGSCEKMLTAKSTRNSKQETIAIEEEKSQMDIIKHLNYVDNAARTNAFNLTENECIIQYINGQNKLFMVLIHQKGSESICIDNTNIKHTIDLYYRAIKTQGNTLPSYSKQLYQLIIAPFADELIHYNKITFIPDRILEGLVFENLSDGKNLLVSTHSISYKYSFDEKMTIKSKPQKKHSLIAFSPLFNKQNKTQNNLRGQIEASNQPSLPFAGIETKQAVAKFADKGLKSKNFTQNVTKKLFTASIQKPGITHLASHGSEKGILLNNDDNKTYTTLNKSDIDSIQIAADLIVLSACKSGVLGINSLPQKLINQGANYVIASLWNVHDEKTQWLMQRFYDHLLTENLDYDEALRKAKLDCINRGYLTIDWAGFILIRS